MLFAFVLHCSCWRCTFKGCYFW